MKKFVDNKLIMKILIIIAVFNFFIPNTFAQQPHDPKKTDQKFAAALQVVRLQYVDTVNEGKLTEAAISAMLKELDPHSVYMSKEDIDKANEPLVGNFDGIGVQFNIIKDTIIVITPTPNGPSEKLGIMSGDKIVKIDGEDAVGKKVNSDYVVKKLRGPKGSSVKVSIFRRGKKELLEYTIVRDKIPINSIDAAYMATDEIGYIKLNKFAQNTMAEFSEALLKLKKNGLKSLILDLRDNSGGYLNTAIELADEFLKKDQMIVYTEGVNSLRQVNNATTKGEFEKGKLVILINEGSASASEIVTGAVQDWDRGLVIGRRSFGKGLVQRPFSLPDQSVIRLTTAHYYTPTGRCVQKPYDEGVEKYYKDLTNRFKHGELMNPDSIKFPDSLKYYTPNKRLVYGGGGIMPDIFIPLDTTRISDYYTDLMRKNIINQFILKYLDGNRDKLKAQYSGVEAFLDQYFLDEQFMDEFFKFSEAEGVKKDEEGFKTSEKYIRNFIKAWVARNLWDYEAYWRISNEQDDVFMEAVKAIESKDMFRSNKIMF
ncbi:MAG TPA: S41 family peptidase [Bacteroidales bacterium]|nr:S41 family peptidase [Bacteroidales bacterium]